MSAPIECFRCEGSGHDFVRVCCGNGIGGECCGDPDTEEQPCDACAGTGIHQERKS